MDKRIRIVFGISIATLLLMLLGQGYWLYNQYQYSATKIVGDMEPVCNQLIKDEEQARYSIYTKSLKKLNGKDTVNIKINIKIDLRRNKEGGQTKSSTVFTFFLDSGKRKLVLPANFTAKDASDMADRYETSRFMPFQQHIIDSLLVAKGYNKAKDFARKRNMPIAMVPHYSIVGSWKKGLRVSYTSNPIMSEGVEFTIPIKTANVIRLMAWQLAVSLLLILILAFCLYYQVQTIIIQKRIDGIRHEFMKNMIFEQKQPKEDATDDCVRVGDTEFRYGLNELRHGNERVILTSRQAEIFRLLAATPNEVVSRERILSEAWGDDSYSNSLALNVQITYLRRAIRSDEKLSIDVVYRKGYVLTVKNKDITTMQ